MASRRPGRNYDKGNHVGAQRIDSRYRRCEVVDVEATHEFGREARVLENSDYAAAFA